MLQQRSEASLEKASQRGVGNIEKQKKGEENVIEDHLRNRIRKTNIEFTISLNPDVADNSTKRTWVNRSERLQGEPFIQAALTSQTPAGVHFA